MIRTPPPPIRKGRAGELSPQFFGSSLKHVHWVRQARRLQALVQGWRRPNVSAGANLHQASLWHAVTTAPGFGPGFRAWWTGRDCQLVGDPLLLPHAVPNLQVAEAVFTSFQANLHAFEKHLLNVRSREAAERRRNAPALIFKDLTDPPVAPVVTLLERTKAKVVEVQPDDAAVVLEREVEWPHSPFVGPRGPVDVHHAEADMLWGDLDDLHVGDEVSQSVVVGSLTDLFKAFGEAWQRRWCRHDVVEPERWQNAVASAQRLARNGSMDLPPTTPELWRATLRSKSARSSTGLDGLSRLDLALMPDDLLQLVLELCSRAEETGLWPRQAVLGVVTALEKRVNSEGVNDYRPITVLSVLYRTWSSIRARQALQYVASFAPPRMYGNMNGRTAGQLWYSVQLAIESSNLRRAPMLGFIADLEKAFNLLPRTPVFALARAVGIAEPIIRGWCGAMVALERRFRIRQSIGPAIRSSTGFPEGCGLSCLAMALVDLALHAHVSDSVLGATLATCVDNWEGHAPDAPTLLLAHRAMEDFTSAWDLKLDVSKTVCWGTTAAARRQLRAAGMKVCLDCRDLGGHLQFSQRRTNYTLTSRLDSLTPLWSRLRASFASTEQKVRALSVSAWPRGLHGVSGVSLGRQHICNLRSGAMYGLAWDRPGANPLLHLSLISYPTSDPEFYAIRQTVLDLRQYTDRHEAAPLITEVVACPGRRPPGPIGVLLERVAMLNWTWDATAETFYDVLCPFCLWDVAIQELELHLVIGWQQHVASLVQERPRFGGLVDVDPLLTRELCKERPGPEQALLQVALGGSFFTEDKLCHFEEGGVPFCRFCGAVDGVRHRVWECPGLESAREQALTPGTPDLAFLPECQLLHAWAMRPAKQFELWRALSILPGSIPPFEMPAPRCAYDLFTDGTCLLPTQPQVRLAAWAVTLAREDSMPPFVLNSGLLPGLIQTSFRAEIFAVLAAVRFCRLVGTPVRIWCDCLGVVRRVRKLLSGSCNVPGNSKNGDLWKWMREETSGLEGLLKLTSRRFLRMRICRTTMMQWRNGCSLTTLMWILRLVPLIFCVVRAFGSFGRRFAKTLPTRPLLDAPC